MKFNKCYTTPTRVFIATLLLSLFSACEKDSLPPSPGPGNGNNGQPALNANDVNVMKFGVNDPHYCSAGSYTNKPCVNLTVCSESGANCTTVTDVLLDSGSFGLRLFKQVIPNIATGSGTLAECMEYGDGSKQWGPIQKVQIKLGNEPAVTAPIQVIDYTFPGMNEKCSGAEKYPGNGATSDYAGFNGILGVGVFQSDCGNYCATDPNNTVYYQCGGGSCQSTTVALSDQVQNPIGLLPVDHNGMFIELPSVPAGGAPSAIGYLVFGVGTRSNNQPGTLTPLKTDLTYGEVATQFNGSTYQSFIDSGSNAFGIPAGRGFAGCDGDLTGWLCPPSTTSYGAIMSSGGASKNISFKVGNFSALFASGNAAFSESAYRSSSNITGLFAWGLPFYYGKRVYLGIEQESTPLGAGPYWAF